MANIQIIVGSVMGTAIEVAKTVEAVLEGCGHSVAINTAFQPSDLVEESDEILVACTSNTGMGDLPENIAPLLFHLKNNCPKVFGRSYAIINLGDSSYPNFAQAGQSIHEALLDLGAQPITESLVIDAMEDEDYEEVAAAWTTALNRKL